MAGPVLHSAKTLTAIYVGNRGKQASRLAMGWARGCGGPLWPQADPVRQQDGGELHSPFGPDTYLHHRLDSASHRHQAKTTTRVLSTSQTDHKGSVRNGQSKFGLSCAQHRCHLFNEDRTPYGGPLAHRAVASVPSVSVISDER